jgi:CDP-glucose 4,6-dehydratase
VSPAFWRGRRIFLTGHTGFKGAWLALWLEQLGAVVSGYALAPETQPNLFALAGVGAQLAAHDLADIRDAGRLASALEASRAEVVFHLAAQSLVRRSYQSPAETFEVNVGGTANLLEAARRSPGVRAVIIVTSDKCYLNLEQGRAFREDDALGGKDPYSASKAAAEVLTAAWRASFFHAPAAAGVASARAGNVIGGGDWAEDRLLVDLVRAFEGGRAARIRYPKATRPWQHVLDALSGYLLLAERLCDDKAAYARAWNFGPDPAGMRSVAEIADLAAARWNDGGGGGARWEQEPGAQPPEAGTLMLDSSLARERLGWRPRLETEDALRWTIDWYRHSSTPQKARAGCMAQIERYMSGAST